MIIDIRVLSNDVVTEGETKQYILDSLIIVFELVEQIFIFKINIFFFSKCCRSQIHCVLWGSERRFFTISIIDSINTDSFEFHLILSKSSSFVREYMVDLS